MIIRVFRGVVQPGKQEEFSRILRQRAIPAFRRHPGMLGVRVGKPSEHSPEEFMVTTVWRDVEALRTFAGDRWFEAKILPDERPLLRRTFVHHYWAEEGERWPPREPPDVIDLGRLKVDLGRRVAALDGQVAPLPPREFAALVELAQREGRPITADELAEHVWPEAPWMNGDDVRRIIYRLRRLLGDVGRPQPVIRNRRGHGYVLVIDGAREIGR